MKVLVLNLIKTNQTKKKVIECDNV